jgi:hypothetical protein
LCYTGREVQTLSSEVARLRELIGVQIEAAKRGLYGDATASSDEVIDRAIVKIEQPYDQLSKLIGIDGAKVIVREIWAKHMSQKPTLLAIKQTTTVTTADIAELAKLSIGDVYAVEIGGFIAREKADKVVRAFCVLSGIEINIDDIKLNSPNSAISHRAFRSYR